MLTLPRNWISLPGGGLAHELFKQVRGSPIEIEFGRCLFAASLDLMAETFRTTGRSPLRVQTLRDSTWRINNMRFVYLPFVNDETLRECERVAKTGDASFITSPRVELVALICLRSVLAPEIPNCWGLCGYLSWRTFTARAYDEWPQERCIMALLAAYRRRITKSRHRDELNFAVPLRPQEKRLPRRAVDPAKLRERGTED